MTSSESDHADQLQALSLAPGITVSVFCGDVDAQVAFYASLLGLTEVEGVRSSIYRALRWGAVELGFHGEAALDLLAMRDRWTPAPSVSHYPTFGVTSDADVETAAERVKGLGGEVLVAPYQTYYNAWQVVMTDPETNAFRVNHQR